MQPDLVDNMLCFINEVNPHWTRLILGWVIVWGQISQLSGQLSQPTTLCGTVKWISVFMQSG